MTAKLMDAFASSWLYNSIGDHTWLARQSRFITECQKTPGGYLPLNMIYDGVPMGATLLARFADWYYLNSPMARAARVRFAFVTEWLRNQIDTVLASRDHVNVLSLACGSARDVISAIAQHPESSRITLVGIDSDPHAVAQARDSALVAGLHDWSFVVGNVLKPKLSGGLTVDLAVAVGLFDYFSDTTVRRVCNSAHEILSPGGSFLLGMTANNPSRPFFENRLNWKLVYRTEDQMLEVLSSTRFGSVELVCDCNGCFVLLECTKEEAQQSHAVNADKPSGGLTTCVPDMVHN